MNQRLLDRLEMNRLLHTTAQSFSFLQRILVVLAIDMALALFAIYTINLYGSNISRIFLSFLLAEITGPFSIMWLWILYPAGSSFPWELLSIASALCVPTMILYWRRPTKFRFLACSILWGFVGFMVLSGLLI